LLLALASGFVFAYLWERTRYLSLRSEGQQLYLLAAVFAVPLLIASRVLLWAPSLWEASCLPAASLVEWVGKNWTDIAGPLYAPALPTFFVAFLLGVATPLLLNKATNRNELSGQIIMRYGSQLEKYLYETITHKLPISVSLDNRKCTLATLGACRPRPSQD
jgi:hypothetical protein